jgi:hypothetical protein
VTAWDTPGGDTYDSGFIDHYLNESTADART